MVKPKVNLKEIKNNIFLVIEKVEKALIEVNQLSNAIVFVKEAFHCKTTEELINLAKKYCEVEI